MSLQAQESSENDSLLLIPKVAAKFIVYEDLIYLKDSFASIAERIDLAQRQLPSRRDLISYQDLGTHYSPLVNLAGPVGFDNGFSSGNHGLDFYKYDAEKQRYYHAEMPFTSFRYAQGGQGYIQFQALHTQNVLPTWNIAAGISSFTNQGYGLKQFQSHRAPFINSHFTLPNNRFRAVISASWVNRTGQESGGLSTLDSLTSVDGTNTFSSASLFPVLAPGAERNSLPMGLKNAFDTAKLAHHRALFQYHIGQKYMDTADSIKKVRALFAIGVLIDYKRERWIYRDQSADSVFYRSFQNRSGNGNADSQFMRVITNEIFFNKLQRKKSGFGFAAKVGLQHYEYNQNDLVKAKGLNTYVGGNVRGTIASKILLNADATYFVSGYNQNDYALTGKASFAQKYFAVSAHLNSALKQPEMVQTAFNSAYFKYSNYFIKTLSNNIGVTLLQQNAKNPVLLSADVQNINNYIYFDQTFAPKQLNSALQLLTFKLAKNFNFRSLNANISAFYQETSSTALPLPKWGFKSDLYYQSIWFDSAINLKAGFDIFSNAKHQAYGYQPVLRQFYVNGNVPLGQYPLVDVYFSGKIKTLVIFLKMENVMNAITKAIPYSTQNYPIQPMAFRLGLLWDFYY